MIFTIEIHIVSLLNKQYSAESDDEEIDHDYIVEFLRENQVESFELLYEEIAQVKVKNPGHFKKSKGNFQKIIAYFYLKVMEFLCNTYNKKTVFTKDFFNSVLNIL